MTQCAHRRKDFQSASGHGGFSAIHTGTVKGGQCAHLIHLMSREPLLGLSTLEVHAGCEKEATLPHGICGDMADGAIHTLAPQRQREDFGKRVA